jgi:hypothetical protein
MFIQVKNYYISSITKIHNGFETTIEDKNGNCIRYQFSDITLKFYHTDGKKIKIPQYLAKELVSMANGIGFIYLTEIEKENVLYRLNNY